MEIQRDAGYIHIYALDTIPTNFPVALINYKGDNIPKYACPTVIIDIESSYFMIVASYVRYINIHILLKSQPSIT